MFNTYWSSTVFEHMVKILNPLYRKTMELITKMRFSNNPLWIYKLDIYEILALICPVVEEFLSQYRI